MLFVKAFDKSRKYRVGFDLCDDYSQISFAEAGKEVQTFEPESGSGSYNIPTLLYYIPGTDTWHTGRDAAMYSSHTEGTLITHLIEEAAADNTVTVGEKALDPVKLLTLFVRSCLEKLAYVVPTQEIGVLMFTLRTLDQRSIEMMEKVMEDLPVPRERIFIEEHDSSFYHYMLEQDPMLRDRGALLCEYKGYDRMQLSRLSFNRRTTPVVSSVRSTEYGSLPYTSPLDMDMSFLRILQQEMAKESFSSAHLIGEGFGREWMKDSIQLLCRNCRVFQGDNLYSKGAAVSASYKADPPQIAEEYFFLSESKLKSNIGLQAIRNGEEGYFPLLDAGCNWYEAQHTEDFILEGTNELQLIMMPLSGGRASRYTIRLDELPVREDRMTRIRLSLSLKTAGQLQVRIRDLGFGEIFPASGLRWEKGISL
ncbi:MAG: hypothetical protein J6I56_00690 [Lachnospiraceae bacterium]|nr:hypothetical protein [Lachnospiraceae bacterium]